MNHQPKGVRYGGRQKGTPNRRKALDSFLKKVFKLADPVEIAEKLLKSDQPDSKLLIRLLEYKFGRPPQEITGPDGGAIPIIQWTGLPRRGECRPS
jgi:hypothetical protein